MLRTRDNENVRLDGNAIGRLLRELFAAEVTQARGACAGCGAVGALGAQHLYMHPLAPGAVLRCRWCEGVLMVLVRAEGHVRLAVQGMAWLDIDDNAAGIA
jgi:hypothetical protein